MSTPPTTPSSPSQTPCTNPDPNLLNRVQWVHGSLTDPQGIGTYAQAIRRRLKEAGAYVHEVDPPELHIGRHRLGGYLSRFLWQLWPFSSPKADLTHAANFFQLRRSTDILTVHDLEIIHHRDTEYGPAGWIWQQTLRLASDLDAIVCPSQHVRRRIEATNHIDAPRIDVIPHGLDHIDIQPDPVATRHSFPPSLRSSTRPWILMVGAYRPRKRFAETLQNAQDLNGTLIHAGPTHNPHRRNLIHQAADDLNVPIHELGYISRDNLVWLYQNADVLLHPSRNEGFGFTPLEAAYHGTPSLTGQAPVFDETLGPLQAPISPNLTNSINQALNLNTTKLQTQARDHTWQNSFNHHAQLWTDLLNED